MGWGVEFMNMYAIIDNRKLCIIVVIGVILRLRILRIEPFRS